MPKKKIFNLNKITNFFVKKSGNKDSEENSKSSSKSKSTSSSKSCFSRSKTSSSSTINNEISDIVDNYDVQEEKLPETAKLDDEVSRENELESQRPQITSNVNQPIIQFPVTIIGGKKRKFCADWYNKFKWLEYDVSLDAVFCGICRLYPVNQKYSNTFQTTGVRDWKNGIQLCSKHQNSETHKKNQMLWLNKKNVKVSCATLLVSHHQTVVDLNRKNLAKIINIVYFLAKQGLAFRGRIENSDSKNRGNFLEMINFLNEYDHELKTHMNNKVANYSCKDSQNEIISLLASQIRKKLLPKVSQFYSLIADESMDISKLEQVTVYLRYVNDDLIIQERFFGFFAIAIQTADAIFDLLKTVLLSLKLDLNYLVGQAYDGASTMSGCKNGVATKFLEIIPTAKYVHCYAHKLNLSLCDASMKVKDISDILVTIENVSVFIRRSAKRHALFEHIKDNCKIERLKLFCATRWESRYLSIKAFVLSYEYLLTFLEVGFEI